MEPEAYEWNAQQLEGLVRSIALFSVPPARSRSIRSIGYEPDARILALQYRGAPHEDELPVIHAYLNFPHQELEALLTAASMHQYVRTTVEPRYRRVTVLQEPEPLASAA